MSKMFWHPKIVQIFSLLSTFINCFLHARCSLTAIVVQRETHNAISFTVLCSISPEGKKCMKFAIVNGLSKNCPRKYWMTDRSPNRIRTFSEVQNFWTPIYTSSSYPYVSSVKKNIRISIKDTINVQDVQRPMSMLFQMSNVQMSNVQMSNVQMSNVVPRNV